MIGVYEKKARTLDEFKIKYWGKVNFGVIMEVKN